ncbi:hypothetical protein ACFWBB_34660 [Streptomyces sp. NPDC060000]
MTASPRPRADGEDDDRPSDHAAVITTFTLTGSAVTGKSVGGGA